MGPGMPSALVAIAISVVFATMVGLFVLKFIPLGLG